MDKLRARYNEYLCTVMKKAFNRTDYISSPKFYLLNIIEYLSPLLAKDFAAFMKKS